MCRKQMNEDELDMNALYMFLEINTDEVGEFTFCPFRPIAWSLSDCPNYDPIKENGVEDDRNGKM